MGIFGGGKSSQQSQSQQQSQGVTESGNTAYPWAQETYAPAAANGVGASNMLAALLGYGGDPSAGRAAFDTYKAGTGYQSTLDAGSRAITGNQAVAGMLHSGATLKRLNRFGEDTNNQYYNGFLDRLLGASSQGLSAGNLITGAGSYSKGMQSSSGTSTSTGMSTQNPDLSKLIGAAISAIPSDRRLKEDVVKIGEINGLGVYEYRYKWEKIGSKHTGYMADEVKAIYPHALGPDLPGGYMTVDYSKLPLLETANG